MGVLLSALVLGLIPAIIAHNKGRSFFLWYLYGAALFIVALIHSLVISKSEAKRINDLKKQGYFECPYCKELVRSGAAVCPHCQRTIQDRG